MSLSCLTNQHGWAPPIFKVLANNDTGNAPGHQAGVVIPEALRIYFPPLLGSTSEVQPTIDVRLRAELFVENRFVTTVSTRYQYQTWRGERSPESRVTDQLSEIRNLAQGGDILVIQINQQDRTYVRLTLVRRTSTDYEELATFVGDRRWGEVFGR